MTARWIKRAGSSATARVVWKATIGVAFVVVVGLALTTPATGQDLATTLATLLEIETLLASPPPDEAQEELPGMGHKFELFGSAADAQDPDNPTNDVISTRLDIPAGLFVGGAIRRLPPGIKISALDNQVNLKYRFTSPRTCFGNSPRITLFIDANGDGTFDQDTGDFVAQGTVNPPFGTGCPMNDWQIEDMSDQKKRWETTPFVATIACGPAGNPLTMCTWDELELRVTTNFPFHKVISGGLIDDTFGGPGQTGLAHYDLITLENRTLENRQDTVP